MSEIYNINNLFYLIVIIFLIYINNFNSERFLNIKKYSEKQTEQLKEKLNNTALSEFSTNDIENILNLGGAFNEGKLKIKNLNVKGNLKVENNHNCNELEIGDKCFSHRLDIKNKNGTTTHFNHNNESKNYIRGNLKSTNGKLTCDNVHNSDHYSVREVDVRNDKTHRTHFNHSHGGENHIRGTTYHNEGTYNNKQPHANHFYSDNMKLRRIVPRYHCNWGDWGCHTRACNNSGSTYGDIIPMKYNGLHANNEVGGWISHDQHIHGDRYYSGGPLHHHFHEQLRHTNNHCCARWK